jgi:FkbM family methyltransferase
MFLPKRKKTAADHSLAISSLKSAIKKWRRTLFELAGSDKYSRFALNELDRKLARHVPFRNGVFIEAGANDGLVQSNTYWFERFQGWRGILIEPVPAKADACRRNRPKALVVNAALVASDDVKSVRMKTANLMAFVSNSFTRPEDEAKHLESAISVQGLGIVEEIDVPARRMSAILDDLKVSHIDVLSLDVEGYEIEALRGLDTDRHRPGLILVETKDIEGVLDVLSHRYRIIEQLSHHDYLLQTS